jgi:hypothetical protein
MHKHIRRMIMADSAKPVIVEPADPAAIPVATIDITKNFKASGLRNHTNGNIYVGSVMINGKSVDLGPGDDDVPRFKLNKIIEVDGVQVRIPTRAEIEEQLNKHGLSYDSFKGYQAPQTQTNTMPSNGIPPQGASEVPRATPVQTNDYDRVLSPEELAKIRTTISGKNSAAEIMVGLTEYLLPADSGHMKDSMPLASNIIARVNGLSGDALKEKVAEVSQQLNDPKSDLMQQSNDGLSKLPPATPGKGTVQQTGGRGGPK